MSRPRFPKIVSSERPGTQGAARDGQARAPFRPRPRSHLADPAADSADLGDRDPPEPNPTEPAPAAPAHGPGRAGGSRQQRPGARRPAADPRDRDAGRL